MSQKTWEQHWASDDTPWDAGAAAPSLERLLEVPQDDPLHLPRGRALVPGCGSGYDVFALRKAGFDAVGLDVAPGAAQRFRELRAKSALDDDGARIEVGDFFALSSSDLDGKFDVVWDYTFYCAIQPELRPAWKKKVTELLLPGGKLAMLIFPVIAGAPRDQGPPFPLDPGEVVKELEPQFQLISLEPAQASHPGREGKEWLAVFAIS